MKNSRFTQVLKAGCGLLDKVGKSIFMANVKSIVETKEDYIFIQAKVKSALMQVPGGKQQVKREASRISRRWNRRRKVVFIHLNAVPKAPGTIMFMMDNTASWGRRKVKDFK